MAIEFRVDAILGDTSKLQQQLNNLNENINSTIKINLDASKLKSAMGDVEKQFTQTKKVNGEVVELTDKIKIGYQEITTTLNKNNDVLETTKNNYAQQQKDIDNFNKRNLNSIDLEIKKREEGSRLFSQQLQAQMREEANVAKIKEKQTASLNRLGMGTGQFINTKNITDITTLKKSLSGLSKDWADNGIAIQQFSQSIDESGNTITRFTTRQKVVENGVAIWKNTSYAVSSADKQLRKYGETQQEVINSQQTLGSMLTSAIERFAVWGISMRIWTAIGEGINSCIQYAKDLDEALTNVRIVTMGTADETRNLLDEYNQIGQELGASTLDIAGGAVDWLRQGFSEEDTTELVRDSTILSKLALIDNAEATEYLTSALKGYKLEAKDAIGVIDQLVAIDLVAATSAGDLSEAMSRTANMARTTGVEMNELFGILAVISEVTQNSASVVGNAVKTVLSRMSNVKAGVKIDEFGEPLNDVERVLNNIGIALKDNQGEWRDFYDVLNEIAGKWSDLSSTQQSQVTTALGGTRQRENILVALENWDKVQQYAQTGAESAGTALEKYDIVLDSTEAKQAQLTAKMEEFFNNILNSNVINWFIELGQTFFDVLNAGDGLLGKTLALSFALTSLVVVFKTLKTTALVKNFVDLFSGMANVVKGAKTMNIAFMEFADKGVASVVFAIPKLIMGLIAMRKTIDWTSFSLATFKDILLQLNINPVMLGISALIAVVAGGIAIFNHFNITAKEQMEIAKKAKDEYEQTADELKSVNDELQTTNQRIAELNAKDKLTIVEKEELENLKQSNIELEQRIKWLEREKAIKEEEAIAEGEKVVKSSQYLIPTADTTSGMAQTSIIGAVEYYLKEYEKIQAKIDNWNTDLLSPDITDKRKDELKHLIEFNQDTLDGYKTKLEQLGIDIQSKYLDTLTLSDKTKSELMGFQNEIQKIIDPQYIFNTIEKAKQQFPNEIKSLLAQGEAVTADSTIGKNVYKELQEYLDKAGISWGDFIETLKAEQSDANNIDVTPLLSYADAIKAVSDNASRQAISKALKEINKSGYITADTVVKLSESFSGLDQYLTLTANGYKISKEGVDYLNNAMIQEYQIALNEAKVGAINLINQESQKKLAYDATTQSIKEQLNAQLALIRDTTIPEVQEKYRINGQITRGYESDKDYQQAITRRDNLLKALKDIENSEKNLKTVSSVVDNILKGKPSKTGARKGTTDELKALREVITSLEHPANLIDKKISAIGKIDTIDEMNTQFDLLGQKLVIVQRNLSIIQDKLKNSNLTKKQREYLEEKMYSYQAEIAKIQDALDNVRLNKIKKQLDDLQKPIDDIDKKIKALGNINTIEEKAKESDLLAEKFRLISSNIETINNLLNDSTLSDDMRKLLEDKLQALIVARVAIKDDIEENVRKSVELEKENALLEKQLEYKEKLYNLEVELYGDEGKEAYEHRQQAEIDRLQSIVDARNEAKEAEEKISEEEEHQNKLLDAKIKLQNALNNKTTKILTKQADGSWEFEYSANMSDVKNAQKELEEAQKAYDDFKYQQETDKTQQEIDRIQKEVEDKNKIYEDANFELSQNLEKQTNLIEEYYVDIEKITQDRMADYQEAYGEAWDEVIKIAQEKYDKLSELNTQLEGKSEYAFETVSNIDFDSDEKQGEIANANTQNINNALLNQSNDYLQKFISQLSEVKKMVDMTKYYANNYGRNGQPYLSQKSIMQNVISKVECVFPNITTTDGLQKAILDLPRLALQKN